MNIKGQVIWIETYVVLIYELRYKWPGPILSDMLQVLSAHLVNLLKYPVSLSPYGISLGLSKDRLRYSVVPGFSLWDLSFYPQLSTLYPKIQPNSHQHHSLRSLEPSRFPLSYPSRTKEKKHRIPFASTGITFP